MNKQVILEAVGIGLGMFMGAVIMMIIFGSQTINWLLAALLATAATVAYAVLSVVWPRKRSTHE